MSQMPHSLDMVGMVMGNEHGIYLRKHHTPLLKVVPQGFHGNTGIYKYLRIIRCQIIAITAAATAQGYEFYHARLF
jgi:hypothetical protein